MLIALILVRSISLVGASTTMVEQIVIDDTPLSFTEEQFAKLPVQVQEAFLNSEGTFIASVATIHIVKETEKGFKLVQSINYDFRNDADIEKYNQDIALLEANQALAFEDLGLTVPLSQNDYGIIVTGLNVNFFRNGHYTRNFQLHGWWEWKNDGWVSSKDRVTLSWSHRLKSQTSTHNCSAVWTEGGSSFSLPKIAYVTEEAIIWHHNKIFTTNGAASAQVGHNSIYDTFATLNFRYAATGGISPTGYQIMNYLCLFLGIPSPGPLYFDTSVTAYIPQ